MCYSLRLRAVLAGIATVAACALAAFVPGSLSASAATGDISTVVGGVASGPATTVPQNPVALALNGGALLVSDGTTGTIRSIDPVTRNESAPVGNACIGHSGDGGPASQATIAAARAVAVGPDGSIYLAEAAWNDVRRVSPSGIISTFAGKPNTTGTYGGDGGAATQADLHDPEGLAVDSAGRVYISDHQNYRIRMVDTNGTISTVAGTGSSFGSSFDGMPATQAVLGSPEGLAVDASDNLYIADRSGIRKVSGGVISTVANSGGFETGVAWANGIVYFTDPYLQKAYQVVGGTMSAIAGNGTAGYSGDGGPAPAAQLNSPVGIAADAAGNVFIADTANNRVRVITGGTITTYAGTGSTLTPDGSAASGAQITQAQKVTMDGQGGYYFSEEFNHVVRHVDATGRLTTVAGNGTQGFSGDGGPATSAQLNNPVGLAVDTSGNLYIADQSNGRVRRVQGRTITTVAGGGPNGSFGDGGPAIGATLVASQYLAFDSQGNLYISDNGGSRVRKVDANGTISTYAGGGVSRPGDGVAATDADIGRPAGIAFDGGGNLFIADDSYGSVVRRVDGGSHVITIVAGKYNTPGFGGDRGAPTSAYLSFPQDVQVDAGGDLLIADTGNSRIRAVVNGLIYTAFGTGVAGCGDDNGPASKAEVVSPLGDTLDSAGNLYISEGNRIRVVSDAVGAISGQPSPRPTPPGLYHTLTPSRILDTRGSIGGHPGALTGGRTLDLQVTGRNGVPASGVTAVVINVTVTDTTQPSYLAVYPTGAGRPVASNLNWTAGTTVANLVQVALGSGGAVTFFNAVGSTDVIADIDGYISTASDSSSRSLLYGPVTPYRAYDTRSAGRHPVGPGQTIQVRLMTPGQYALTINLTATNPTAAGYLTAWPDGSPRPTVSNLNFVAGETIANRATVAAGNNGVVDIYNAAGTVDVVVDGNGTFIDSSMGTYASFQGIPPVRILDTRDGTGGIHGRIGPKGSAVLQVAGLNNIPSDVLAVVGNITVTDTSAASYLTAWPDGTTRPTASDLNWTPGATVPNMAVVALSRDGKLDLYNAAGSADVIIDVTGWYR